MAFENLIPPKAEKNLVLVLSSGSRSAIDYSSSSKSEIYTITNSGAFLAYIKGLLKQRYTEVYVIVLFSHFKELVPLIRILRSVNVEGAENYKQDFQKKPTAQNTSNSKPTDPDGHSADEECDLPVPFQLFFILDSKILASDPISTKSIALQQYLRFISVKHGASLVVAENTQDIIENPEDLIGLEMAAQPILELDNAAATNGILVNQYIPRAWDSWSKIILIAKSVGFLSPGSMLATTQDIQDFKILYNSYFEQDTSDSIPTDSHSEDENVSANANSSENTVLLHKILERIEGSNINGTSSKSLSSNGISNMPPTPPPTKPETLNELIQRIHPQHSTHFSTTLSSTNTTTTTTI
ncbi:uncharacterized protein RJT20DRAFT_34425 [Scheffersomyces xylosifermentans]|uniref:uncharacterized protein n=1 Tax=Scheffersomyces xylosifermentans TaxID=1304137 RepID=UPI00315DAC90